MAPTPKSQHKRTPPEQLSGSTKRLKSQSNSSMIVASPRQVSSARSRTPKKNYMSSSSEEEDYTSEEEVKPSKVPTKVPVKVKSDKPSLRPPAGRTPRSSQPERRKSPRLIAAPGAAKRSPSQRAMSSSHYGHSSRGGGFFCGDGCVKLVGLLVVLLCISVGVNIARLLFDSDSSLTALPAPSCGVVPAPGQIGFRLEKPLSTLRKSGEQPFAYDALNRYEKPRLREHFSMAYGEKHLGDFSENTRAVTLHFAGGGSMKLKHDMTARKIAEALFVYDHKTSTLDVTCSSKTNVNQLRIDIARKLIECPRSVVILHDIEKLPSEMKSVTKFGSVGGLISLERFFEDQTVEVAEVGSVDLRQAVFILTSSVGSNELKKKQVVAKDAAWRRTEEVIEVIKKATRVWAASRPALGGRLSNSQVPFI